MEMGDPKNGGGGEDDFFLGGVYYQVRQNVKGHAKWGRSKQFQKNVRIMHIYKKLSRI